MQYSKIKEDPQYYQKFVSDLKDNYFDPNRENSSC